MAVIDRIRGMVPRSRKGWRRLYQGAAVSVLLLFGPVTAVHAYGSGYVHGAAEVPVNEYGVVFGAGVAGDVPTPFLARRLDVALDLYHRHKIRRFLLTGDRSGPDYDEPRVMAAYLLARGVPADVLVQDGAGYDTWESCVRARRVYGLTAATLVTQDFHLPRAVLLCRSAGIDAVGVADSGELSVAFGETMFDRVREVAAGWKALGQSWIQPDPACGGRTAERGGRLSVTDG